VNHQPVGVPTTQDEITQAKARIAELEAQSKLYCSASIFILRRAHIEVDCTLGGFRYRLTAQLTLGTVLRNPRALFSNILANTSLRESQLPSS